MEGYSGLQVILGNNGSVCICGGGRQSLVVNFCRDWGQWGGCFGMVFESGFREQLVFLENFFCVWKGLGLIELYWGICYIGEFFGVFLLGIMRLIFRLDIRYQVFYNFTFKVVFYILFYDLF